jgi:hypothetical protein
MQPETASIAIESTKTSFTMSVNGKANQYYRGKIQYFNKSGKDVLIKHVEIPDGLNLSFDIETCELYGMPSQAGEYTLNVYFQFDKLSGNHPTPIGTCLLIVNPDPKTLWKFLDSDSSDKYWKPDIDSFFSKGSDGLAVLAASKRGRSHAHIGAFRDDDFSIGHDESTGWRILTVADGAGSAKKSRRGSNLVTTIIKECLTASLKGERGNKIEEALQSSLNIDNINSQRPVKEELYYLFGNAAREAVNAIDNEAKIENVPYKEFSTTLIVAIHKKFDFGHFIGAYWVGDGGVGIYVENDNLYALGKPDSGDFAGQTRFLDFAMVNDASEIMKRIQFKVIPDFSAVIAMTDGITDPKFETDVNFENIQKWDALWSELTPIVESEKPEETLLSWLDFWSVGNHDDRTIGIIYPIKSVTIVQETPKDE